MECEICGKTALKRVPVKIEGSIMNVCGSCARFGERVKEGKKTIYTAPRMPRKTKTTSVIWNAQEVELLENYASLIRAARESMGMTQEQLGKEINERESVINRIEGGKMKPDAKLIRKLERTLGVKITGKVKGEKIPLKKSVKSRLTLGDVVEIKK
jgi:putative transcription factor